MALHEQKTAGEIEENADETERENDDNVHDGEQHQSCSKSWTDTVHKIHRPFLKGMQVICHTAAKNPTLTITFVIFVSFLLIVVGLFTNFRVEVDENVLWTPKGSKPEDHSEWIEDESGFSLYRDTALIFHNNGDNVVHREDMKRVFEVLDSVTNLAGYGSVCADSDYRDRNNAATCEIVSATQFWGFDVEVFESEVLSDQDLVDAISNPYYPDGTPVAEEEILGKVERHPDTGKITVARSYMVIILFPDTDETEDFESDVIDVVRGFDERWESEDGNSFHVELDAERSFADEFTRAIVKDIPLVPLVFVVMSIFTCVVFARRDWGSSRSLLGFGAVASVLLGIMAGYGLMFVSGVPFTSMTQILPFIMFGIGLDDSFIIYGSYSRMEGSIDPVTRVQATMEDVGISILLTTMTTTLAFLLGCTSSVPAIYWLCAYAVPTVIFIFFGQLTFFIACLVLDERRIQHRRRDCCLCCTVQHPEEEQDAREPTDSSFDKLMRWYASKLLRVWTRYLVVAIFVLLLVLCGYSTSKLSQEFDFTDVLPSDSYMTDFMDAHDSYSTRTGITMGIYFRYVDQSVTSTQDQMLDYVKELSMIDSIGTEPDYFWLPSFRFFVNTTDGVSELDFNDQLDAFLSDPAVNSLYGGDLVRDQGRNLVASRCFISMQHVDWEDVRQQMDALKEQREVTESQPINKGKDDWPFFGYEPLFHIWQFYINCVEEIILTTTVGIASVTFVTLFFVPHWTAALFILPLICALYIDLLGCMQWAGIHINGVSFITLVMSIGLLVDFLMHVLLRYYECSGNREEKTVEMLRTMGSSILIGGISTFLGTLPLAFSTSTIFLSIFFAFLCLVTLGIGHGLILLPVLLATFGPEDPPFSKPREKREQHPSA